MGVAHGHTRSCICSTILFSLFLFSIEYTYGQCDAQYDALMDIYNATNGENWTNNDNWGSGCDICDWYGISCDVGGNVTGINFYNNGLSGSLPDVFMSFPFLQSFDVYNCDLNGPIPVSLSSLSNLRHLNLDRNDFTGEIPGDFFRLPQIQNLYLRNNQLEGSLPDTITSTTLVNLWVNNNSLSGNIPSAIGNLSSLQTFYFYRNNISGNIPSEIGQCGALRILIGYNNQLEGNLPATFRELSNLEELNLSNNNISGGLELDWSGLIALKSINLNNNSITDPFPSELIQATHLEELRMNNNNVNGDLPAGIGGWSQLEILHLYNNELSGSIPSGIGGLASCTEIDLSRNQLSGSIPSEIGNLSSIVKLKLHDNNLSGFIPSSMCSLPQVRELKLERNNLTGEIPGCIGDLSMLNVLNISHNQLSGQPPESLGLLSNLSQISFFDNQLTGCYPDNYFNFCSINPLAFENNCMNLGFQEFCSGSSCSLDSALYILSSMGDIVCEGETIELSTVSEIDGWLYEWSTGDAGVNLEQILIMPTQPAQYSVTVTTTDGCTFSDVIEIQVVDVQVSIQSDTEYCFQSSGYQLEASPSGGIWSGDHVSETGMLIPVTTLTDYEVFYEYSDVNGCTETIDTIIQVNPTIETDVFASICEGENYEVGGEVFDMEGVYEVILQTEYGCDSMVHLFLAVNETEQTDVFASICEGENYEVGGEVFDMEGVYEVTLQTEYGCDSMVYLDLTVNPTFEIDTQYQICEGEDLIIGNETFNENGSYSVTLLSLLECDSVINFNLSVLPVTEQNISETICAGDTIFIGTEAFYESGIHQINLISTSGCDSIVLLNLTIHEHEEEYLEVSICEEGSYEYNGITYTEGGIYTTTVDNGGFCEVQVTIDLTVHEIDFLDVDTTMCHGGSIFYFNTVINQPGYHFRRYTNINGCDSIIRLHIREEPLNEYYITDTLCVGDQYQFGSLQLTSGGNYNQLLSTDYGCDSMVYLNLIEQVEDTIVLSEAICPGEEYDFYGTTISEPGSYMTALDNGASCNTNVLLELEFIETSIQQIDTSICNGETLQWEGLAWNEPGFYTVFWPNPNGCTDTLLINLQVIDSDTIEIEGMICEGEGFEYGGITYETEGVFYQEQMSEDSCPYIARIIVQEIQSFATVEEIEICEGDNYIFQGDTLYAPGNYSYMMSSINGCDSTVTLTILESQLDTIFSNISLCEGEIYTIQGIDYSAPSTIQNVIENPEGCNTIEIIELDFIDISSEEIESEICEGDFFIFQGDTLSESGSYTYTMSSIDGCDSIITLNITAASFETIYSTIILCEGETYSFQGIEYTPPATIENIIENTDGCDTIEFIELDFINISTEEIDVEVCEGDFYIFEGDTLSESGSYTYTMPSVYGCDSIITLNITSTPFETIHSTVSLCEGEIYTVKGIEYSAPATIKNVIENPYGCNTIEFIHLDFINSTSEAIEVEICEGEAYQILDETFTTNGLYKVVTQNVNGCDSVINVSINVLPIDYTELEAIICEGESYEYNGILHQEQGPYTYSYTNGYGCDSLVALHLVVIEEESERIDVSICEGSSYQIAGMEYSEPGTHEILLDNGECSQSVSLNLTVESLPEIQVQHSICPGETFMYRGFSFDSPGTYEQMIPSSSGCDTIVNLVIEIYDVEDIEISGPNQFCEGSEIYLAIDAEGGIKWSNGATTSAISVVEGGTYYVSVTDDYGCMDSAGYFVKAISIPEVEKIIVENPTDCEVVAGRIEVETHTDAIISIDGGASWTQERVFNSLSTGVYELSIATNDTVCVSESTTLVELVEEQAIWVDSVEYYDGVSCSEPSGIIIVHASSVDGALEYSLDHGDSWQDNKKFSSLNSGIYQPLVRIQGKDCIEEAGKEILISEPTTLQVAYEIIQPPECPGDNNGMAAISVGEDESGYSIMWPDGQNELTAYNLEAGTHHVMVTSSDGCESWIDVVVPEPAAIPYESNLPSDTMICIGTEMILSNLSGELRVTWYNDEGYFSEGDSMLITDEGMIYLEVSDGRSCFVEDSIYINVIVEDYTGIDFLLSAEGLLGSPMVIVDVSWPEVDSVTWEFQDSDVVVLDVMDNQVIVEFPDTGIYEVTMIADVGVCPFYITKQTKIVGDESELTQPGSFEGLGTFIQDFNIFPNPNIGIFSTRLGLQQPGSVLITIVSSIGRMVHQQTLHNESLYILMMDISDEPPGIYTIIVQNEYEARYISFSKN